MAHYNCNRQCCKSAKEIRSVVDYCRKYSHDLNRGRTGDRSLVTHLREKKSVYAKRQNLMLAVSLVLLIALPPKPVAAQNGLTLRVGLVVRDNQAASAASVSRGVQLGAAEAKETAALFGGGVLLFQQSAGGNIESAASRLLSRRKVQILIGSSAADADALSRFAERNGLIFFNTASRSTMLRAACRRHTFQIEASDSMYAAALRVAGGRADSALLWVATLERYGASQINERYRNKYRLPMDAGAWAGWLAVKIAAEAALRARSTRAGALVSYLEASSTSFDGHKGWPLSFRSGDHQLRQPLYVVVGAANRPGAKVRDVPPLSELSAGGTNANANVLLDRLIPSAPSCVRSST